MLVSSVDSFFVYRPADNRFFEVAAFYPELAPIRHISVNSIAYASDSLAIIGTENSNGSYVWNLKKRSLKINCTSNGRNH